MPDESLLLLVNEIRNKTLKLLDGLSDDDAQFKAAGMSNSILWHAGHALIVNEHLGVTHATGKPVQYPEGWFEKFSWKSRPAEVKDWPKLADVVEQLRDQQKRLAGAVQTLTSEQLSKVVDPDRGRTMRYMILHALHDEANHQGEIWLLKKLRTSGKEAPLK